MGPDSWGEPEGPEVHVIHMEPLVSHSPSSQEKHILNMDDNI